MEGVPIKETMLSDMCPDIESAFCFPHKYRTINGECNNVKNPTWGITGAAYLRILEPTYQDGECLILYVKNFEILYIRVWEMQFLSCKLFGILFLKITNATIERRTTM